MNISEGLVNAFMSYLSKAEEVQLMNAIQREVQMQPKPEPKQEPKKDEKKKI